MKLSVANPISDTKMTQEEFIHKVQMYSLPESFEKNKHLLNDVHGWQHEAFIHCLDRGAEIPNAFKALNLICTIMDNSYLTHKEILPLLNTFTLLNKTLFPSLD